MINLKRTTSNDADFRQLVSLLDQYLALRDGEEHAFYNQFNNIQMIRHVVVCYCDDLPAGCGAFKELNKETIEIKRMFVKERARRKGIGVEILNELETWAAELSYANCVLETGKRQPEAIGFYEKAGYHRIKNYGQYEQVENSICMKKILI